MHIYPNASLSVRAPPSTRRIRPTLLNPKERNILPQRHIFAIRIPQRIMDLRAMQPLYSLNLARRVIHHCAPNLERSGVVQLVQRRRDD